MLEKNYYPFPYLGSVWTHKLHMDRDNIFFIFITENDLVGVCDSWHFSDFSTPDFRGLLKDPISPDMVNKLQKFKAPKVEEADLKDLFLNYLNNHTYLEDLYLPEGCPDGDLQHSFSVPRNNCKLNVDYALDIESLLYHFEYYFLLGNCEIELSSYGYDLDGYGNTFDNTKEYWVKVIDLIYSCYSVSGSNYEYNDGAYNRESGYSEYNLYISIDPKEKDTYFERENKLVENDSDLIKAKRAIIQFLQAYAPLNIRNLKKLNSYIYGYS